jgi:hypothetical protein
MLRNPARWQIPLAIRSIVHDPEFKEAVGKALTNARSTIKSKVCGTLHLDAL